MTDKNIDLLVHDAEMALCQAVKDRRDFHQSAGWIKSMVMKLNVSIEKQKSFVEELIEFFNTYPKGKKTDDRE